MTQLISIQWVRPSFFPAGATFLGCARAVVQFFLQHVWIVVAYLGLLLGLQYLMYLYILITFATLDCLALWFPWVDLPDLMLLGGG